MNRSMLKENNLPHTFQGEVFSTATYMLNSCPTKKLKETIPSMKWNGDKKSVSHLKVFGFVCYKHVPIATRRKLDDRSKVMLLIKYQITCDYNLYCPITKKFEVSRDIIVKESQTWGQNKSQSSSEGEPEVERGYSSEDEPKVKSDSDSDDESEVDGDSTSEDEPEADEDSASNDESDSGPDSDDDLESGRNPTSEGGTSRGSPESENVPASGQGGTFEGGTFGDSLESDTVQSFEQDSEQVQIPQRIRQIPMRFAEFDML